VICPLTGHKPRPRIISARRVISHDDLESRVHSLGTGVHKEDVVDFIRRHLGDLIRQHEARRMGHAKRRSVGIHLHLLVDGFDDLGMTVTRRRTEETRRAVNNVAAAVVSQVVPFSFNNQTGLSLKAAIGSLEALFPSSYIQIIGAISPDQSRGKPWPQHSPKTPSF